MRPHIPTSQEGAGQANIDLQLLTSKNAAMARLVHELTNDVLARSGYTSSPAFLRQAVRWWLAPLAVWDTCSAAKCVAAGGAGAADLLPRHRLLALSHAPLGACIYCLRF